MNFLVGALASGVLSGNSGQQAQSAAPASQAEAPSASGGQGAKSSADVVGDVVNTTLGEQQEEG